MHPLSIMTFFKYSLTQNKGQRKNVMNKISFIIIMGWCYLGIVVGKMMIWKHGLPNVHVKMSSSI